MHVLRFVVSALCLSIAVVAATRGAAGAPQAADGFYETGKAIQTAHHWPFSIDVFAMWHYMKQLPQTKTKQAIIDADIDKRFALATTYEFSKVLATLADASLKKDDVLNIVYDARAKTTTFGRTNGPSTQVDGVPFMTATWSIWFGSSRPGDIGDRLMSGF
jgi:hypothetical protein